MTEVSLREYIERIIDERSKAHDQRHYDEAQAIDQARAAVDLRLEKLNELRSEVLQDRGQFVRRDVYDNDKKGRDLRLQRLESWQARASGAAVILTLIAGLIGAAVMRALGG